MVAGNVQILVRGQRVVAGNVLSFGARQDISCNSVPPVLRSLRHQDQELLLTREYTEGCNLSTPDVSPASRRAALIGAHMAHVNVCSASHVWNISPSKGPPQLDKSYRSAQCFTRP
jgi:hypothetical protein